MDDLEAELMKKTRGVRFCGPNCAKRSLKARFGLIQFLKNSGRFSYYGQSRQSQPTSNISADEAYKILGLKKGCSKEEVIKAANLLQKKIHPDVNPNSNTERLSQIVNEAKEIVLNDIS